jgi:micrococcal nuclease
VLNHLLLLPALLLLTLSPVGYDSIAVKEISGKVVKVKDGDTIEVLVDGKAVVVRLEHVDCPEKSQPFGNAAKQFTSGKCFGKLVTVQHSNKKDRNGRLIGVILVSGDNLNEDLVRAGLAWHFKKYSKDQSYDILEQRARSLKRGLWKDTDAVAPWEWRKPKK